MAAPQMMTISKEQLECVIGGRGGHGEVPGPEVDGCMFKAMGDAGREVDALTFRSKAEKDAEFQQRVAAKTAACRAAKR